MKEVFDKFQFTQLCDIKDIKVEDVDLVNQTINGKPMSQSECYAATEFPYVINILGYRLFTSAEVMSKLLNLIKMQDYKNFIYERREDLNEKFKISKKIKTLQVSQIHGTVDTGMPFSETILSDLLPATYMKGTSKKNLEEDQEFDEQDLEA